MQAYGNLFQGRQTVACTTGSHAFKLGFEARINRDTTYFGISPNGEYDFGGGTAYATRIHPLAKRHAQHQSRRSAARHAFQLSLRQPVRLYRGLAPPYFSPTASTSAPRPSTATTSTPTRRTHGRSRHASRSTTACAGSSTRPSPSAPTAPGGFLRHQRTRSNFVVNPQPGYKTDWNGWAPRVQAAWQVTQQILGSRRRGDHRPFRRISGRITSSPAPRPLSSIRACVAASRCADPLRIPNHSRRSCPMPIRRRAPISSPPAIPRPFPPTR